MYKEALKLIWTDIVICIIVYLIFGFEVFVAIALLILYYQISLKYTHLLKIIRVYYSFLEAKLTFIIKKLDISKEELKKYSEEFDNEFGEKGKDMIEKDIKDLRNI